MNNKDTPAMPLITPDYVYYGLTKREYVAAQVMQGLLSSNPDRYLAVKHAVSVADTLLDALEEGNG